MRGYGNINLKGKKTKALSCGCCIAFNLKDKQREKLAKKEIREALIVQW